MKNFVKVWKFFGRSKGSARQPERVFGERVVEALLDLAYDHADKLTDCKITVKTKSGRWEYTFTEDK